MSNPITTHEANTSILHSLLTGSVGALTSRSVQWLSDRVNDISGWHFGKTLDAVVPSRIRKVFTWCANNVQYPIDRPKNRIQDLFITEDERINLPDNERERKELRRDLFMRVIYSPVLEEVVYRGLLQTGISVSLEMLGAHLIVSKTISVFCTTVIFGLAHEEEFASNGFTSTAIPGLVMGIFKERYGLPASTVAHMMHNFSIVVVDKLNKHWLFKRAVH